MHPILVRFGPDAVIYSGHFMFFLGTLAAIVVLSREMKRTGERPDEIYGLLLLLFLSAIAGSRLLYCIDFNAQHRYSLKQALQFWKGGMALHGGALFGLVTFTLYVRWRRLEFWRIADLLTPPAALFVTFARGGCILMGCCYGKQCDPDFPLAMTFTVPLAAAPRGVPLYPTQPLFMAAALLVFFVVLGLRRRKPPAGETALIGISLFSLLAFLIEFLRSDLRVLYDIGGITLSQNQVIGALVFLAVTALYFYRKAKTGRPSVFGRSG